MLKRFTNWLRGVFNRIEGASTWSANRSTIYHGYQSARFDASKSERKVLVTKARYFECNNSLVNRLADIFENYTVGSGTPVIPNSSNPDWNKRAAASWEKFCKYPCVNSRMGFGTFQSLVARRWFIDGECFILMTNGDNGKPRIQLIETHLVNTPPALETEEGDSIIDGVNIDRSQGGRPIGYFIGQENKLGQISYGVATAAKYVIHVCEPSRAAEYRCLPFSSCCINLIHDLDDLHMYEMKAAKDAAESGLFIETQSGEMDAKTVRAARYSVAGINKDGATTETRTQYYKDTTGGRAQLLKAGDKVTQMPGARPSVVTQAYWRTITEQVCNAMGIPYIMAMPESLQGTVYRGSLDMASTFFEARFLTLKEAWVRVYEYYMEWAIKNDPSLRGAPADWYSCTIQAPRAPNVDVGYNAAAMISELEAGTTNYDLVFGPRGKDWRVELRKKAEQVAYIKSLADEFKVEPEEISAFKLTAEPAQPQQTTPNETELATS